MSEEVKPIKSERIDNSDGSYIVKVVWGECINGILSQIEYYNSDNFLIKILWYSDNFKTLNSTDTYKYFDNGTSEVKTIYENTNYCESNCIIRVFNKNGNLIARKDYKDKECKNLYYTKTKQKNNNYIHSRIYDLAQEEIGYLSCMWETNKKGNYIWQKCYADKGFKQILAIHNFEYLKNNIIIRKIVYSKKHLDRYLSKIEKYKDGKIINKFLYADKKFNILIREDEYIYKENGNRINIQKSHRHNDGIALFAVQVKDNNENLIEEIGKFQFKKAQNKKYKSLIQVKKGNNIYTTFYKKLNFENLIAKSVLKHKKNKKCYTKKYIFNEIYDGKLSSIIKANKKEVYEISYEDKYFKNIYSEAWAKYNKSKIKIKLTVYIKPKDGYYAILSKYDKDNNLIFEKKYKSKIAAKKRYNIE